MALLFPVLSTWAGVGVHGGEGHGCGSSEREQEDCMKLQHAGLVRPEVIFKEFNHPVSVLMGANLANEVALGQSRALSGSMQSELE